MTTCQICNMPNDNMPNLPKDPLFLRYATACTHLDQSTPILINYLNAVPPKLSVHLYLNL